MLPTQADNDALLHFLPLLYPGETAIEAYSFKDGHPWPIYARVVEEFYQEASKECWVALDYRPTADRLVREPDAIEQASLEQLQCLITYCVRGERFCDGHWGGDDHPGFRTAPA